MTVSKSRIWAKAVAIVDLAFYVLSATLFILFAITLAFVGVAGIFGEENPTGQPTGDQEKSAAAAIFAGLAGSDLTLGIILLMVLLVLAVLHIWFSYNLLRATSIGADTVIALQQSKPWRIFAIVLFCLSFLFTLRFLSPVAIIGLIFRGLSLWVVHRYIKELESEQQPMPHKRHV